MSKERLGKIEKWILAHCYLKAYRELPAGWIKHKQLERFRPQDKKMENAGLCKDEVLFNCFAVPPAEDRPPVRKTYDCNIDDPRYSKTYWTGPAYRSGMVGYNRSVKRLIQKGLIRLWSWSKHWMKEEYTIKWHDKNSDWIWTDNTSIICLTAAGKEKAKTLLNDKHG